MSYRFSGRFWEYVGLLLCLSYTIRVNCDTAELQSGVPRDNVLAASKTDSLVADNDGKQEATSAKVSFLGPLFCPVEVFGNKIIRQHVLRCRRGLHSWCWETHMKNVLRSF